MEIRLLEKILDYDFTKDEAKAWKIAIFYVLACQKYAKNYFYYRVPKKDPRKTSLFRYAYKCLHEFNNKLQPTDWQQFVTAQIIILVKFSKENSLPLLIGPHCICGANAWQRWLTYCELYKNQVEQVEKLVKFTVKEVREKLLDAKKFLLKNLKVLTVESIAQAFASKILLRWLILGLVHPIFIVLYQKIDSSAIEIIDFNLYNKMLPKEASEIFKEVFACCHFF